jgi:hypothetical protein
MKRGEYDAGLHVGFAFFGEVAIASAIFAKSLSSIVHVPARSDGILVLAAIGGVVFTLWLFSNRFRCIEAFASRFSSGVANLSIFYVPFVVLFYANYRGVTRLFGR